MAHNAENIYSLAFLQKMFVNLCSRGKMGMFWRKDNLEKTLLLSLFPFLKNKDTIH